MPYVNPSQGDKIVFILHFEKLFFVLRAARVRSTFLFWNQQMRNPELIVGLRKIKLIIIITSSTEI